MTLQMISLKLPTPSCGSRVMHSTGMNLTSPSQQATQHFPHVKCHVKCYAKCNIILSYSIDPGNILSALSCQSHNPFLLFAKKLVVGICAPPVFWSLHCENWGPLPTFLQTAITIP